MSGRYEDADPELMRLTPCRSRFDGGSSSARGAVGR